MAQSDDQGKPQVPDININLGGAGSLTPEQIEKLKAQYGKPQAPAEQPAAQPQQYKPLDQLESEAINDAGQAIGHVMRPPQTPFEQMKAQYAPQQPAAAPGPKNIDLGTHGQGAGASNASMTQEAPQNNPYTDAMTQAYQAQVNALHAQGAAAQGMAGAQQGQLAAEQDYYADSAKKAQQLTDDYQQRIKSHEEELHNALKDYNEGHIDPEHFHESRSIPQKIRSAIGMLVAGIGSGLLRQENPVIRWMNQQVDRDIEAQKANINSAYNHYRDQMGDARQAENMTRALLEQNLANNIKSTAAKFGGQMAQQQANALTSNYEANAQKLLGENAMAQAQMKMQQLAREGKAPLSALPKEEREAFVPAFHMAATTKEAANKFNEEVFPTAQSVASTIDRLKALAAKDHSSISPADKKSAQSLAIELQGHLAKGWFSKTTQNELGMLEHIASNPTDIFSIGSANMAALDTINKSIEDEMLQKATAIGLDQRKYVKPASFTPLGQ